MSREYTNTNSDRNSEPIPDGRRTFRVLSVRKYMKGQTEMYFWELKYDEGEGTQLLLPNMMGELLRLLGAKETEKGEFDWETDLMQGKYFDASVSHGVDKKGIMRQSMTEFAPSKEKTDDIPF
jgi:hypothetical protein